MAQQFVFKDFSSFQWNMSRNGGSYGFTETAVVVDGKIVSGSYWTTADFSFCPNCGRFVSGSHEDCTQYEPSWVMEAIVRGEIPEMEDGCSWEVSEI